MFNWFKTTKSTARAADTQADRREAHLGATALMVEVAMADGIYASIEGERILKFIKSAFKLEHEAAQALLDEAEQVAEAAVDHHRFTHAVKTQLSASERIEIIEGLWRVVFADGEEAAIEDAMVRRLAPLLAVSDRQSRKARKDVAAMMGISLG